jgi:hypothetical protein
MNKASPRNLLKSQNARVVGLGVLLVFAKAYGCASKVTHTRADSAVVDPTIGLTILSSPVLVPETARRLGEKTAECVASAIANDVPTARVITAEHFRGSVLFDLPAENWPLSRESLESLSTGEALRGRLATAGISYIIAVGGQTTQPRPRGGGVTLAGAGGAGVFGFWLWERDSTLWAEIVEVASGKPVAKVEATVNGRPWFLMAGIFPIGAPSFTETWACYKLGQGVVEALTIPRAARP